MTATGPIATGPTATGPPAPPPRREPADRGRLHISPFVLRRIAEHVADHSPGTTTGRRRLGAPQGASARVRTDGEIVEVDLDVALIYPMPVRETVADVRRRVVAEVDRLTGRRVRTVAVTVVALLPETRPRVT